MFRHLLSRGNLSLSVSVRPLGDETFYRNMAIRDALSTDKYTRRPYTLGRNHRRKMECVGNAKYRSRSTSWMTAICRRNNMRLLRKSDIRPLGPHRSFLYPLVGQILISIGGKIDSNRMLGLGWAWGGKSQRCEVISRRRETMFLIEQLLTLIYFDPVMMWKKIYDITRITLTQTPTRVFPSLLPVNPSIVHL